MTQTWQGVGKVYYSGPSGVSVRVTRRAVPGVRS